MGTSTVRNEVGNQEVLVGTEAIVGTAVTPDYRWMGEFAATKSQPRVDKPIATGGYFRRVSPRRGVVTFAGTYGEDLTFESLAQHLQYWLKSGAAGVSDGETIPGYVHSKSPSFAADDIASATVQYGVDGLAYLCTGVRHNEGTITIDPDDQDGVWKFSATEFIRSKDILGSGATGTGALTTGTATGGTARTVVQSLAGWTVDAFAGAYVNVGHGTSVGQVRLIASNTADTLTIAATEPDFSPVPASGNTFRIEGEMTAGITVPDPDVYEYIPSWGTQVYIDPLSGTIGTTEVEDRIISTNVTFGTNRTPKRFLNNGPNEVSSKTGRGEALVSGQLRVEFDRTDEYFMWEQLQGFQLRIHQNGSVIDPAGGPATTKYARIDVAEAYFDEPTPDARESNMTLTLPWTAYGTVDVLTIEAKTTIATLP